MASRNTVPLVVVFDIDGVLIDFEHLNRGYRTSTLSGFGLTGDQAEQGVAIWEDLVQKGHPRRDVPGLVTKIAERFGVAATKERLDAGYAACRQFLDHGLQAIPGMVNLVRQLQAQPDRFLLGVASNGSQDNQHSKLQQIGLEDAFAEDAIVIMNPKDPLAKPNGYPVTRVADVHRHRTGRDIARNQVVMIGDRQSDIDAGADAGAITILFTPGNPLQESIGSPTEAGHAQPDYVVNSVEELLEVLESLYASLNHEAAVDNGLSSGAA